MFILAKIIDVQDKSSGKIYHMRFASTQQEMDGLVKKYKEVLSIVDSPSDSSKVLVQKNELRFQKRKELIEYCRQTGMVFPVKFFVSEAEKGRWEALPSPRDIYSTEIWFGISKYFFEKKYANDNPNKLNVSFKDWMPTSDQGYRYAIAKEKLSEVANKFNSIIGRILSYKGIPLTDCNEEAKTVGSDFTPDDVHRDAMYQIMEVLVGLYKPETIKAFVNSEKYQPFEDKVTVNYHYFLYDKKPPQINMEYLLRYLIGPFDRFPDITF